MVCSDARPSKAGLDSAVQARGRALEIESPALEPQRAGSSPGSVCVPFGSTSDAHRRGRRTRTAPTAQPASPSAAVEHGRAHHQHRQARSAGRDSMFLFVPFPVGPGTSPDHSTGGRGCRPRRADRHAQRQRSRDVGANRGRGYRVFQDEEHDVARRLRHVREESDRPRLRFQSGKPPPFSFTGSWRLAGTEISGSGPRAGGPRVADLMPDAHLARRDRVTSARSARPPPAVPPPTWGRAGGPGAGSAGRPLAGPGARSPARHRPPRPGRGVPPRRGDDGDRPSRPRGADRHGQAEGRPTGLVRESTASACRRPRSSPATGPRAGSPPARAAGRTVTVPTCRGLRRPDCTRSGEREDSRPCWNAQPAGSRTARLVPVGPAGRDFERRDDVPAPPSASGTSRSWCDAPPVSVVRAPTRPRRPAARPLPRRPGVAAVGVPGPCGTRRRRSAPGAAPPR